MESKFHYIYAQSPLYGKKSPLPPIVCERDKAALKEVQDYIKTELEKSRCSTPGPDNKRFSIYSTAFSLLISKVKVYRDILSDIKREYEECINALRNGEREVKFLQCKVKTMSSIPTTINGYLRRQKELEERLAILKAENTRLESILHDLLKSQQESDEEESDEEQDDNEMPEKIELRPIPGMPVSDWTNEEALKAALDRLGRNAAELEKQKKNCYVPIEKRQEAMKDFESKMIEKEQLAEQCQKLKRKHKILKMANEAAKEYKELGLYKSGESLSQFIMKKVTEYSIKRETSGMVESPYSVFEDDDPTKEREAEMILDYIERFNELFFDGEYAAAATHAAISPRGVLRDAETLLRFKEVSEGCTDSPTPLLMFAEAFMYSSTAQSHFANEDISYECVNCALNEKREDMALHWMSQGLIKSCKKVADRLLEFAMSSEPHNESCIAAAQKIYTEIDGCKIIAAVLLYKLNQPARMLDFATTEKFTRETYFELIKQCMDGELIWILSQTALDEYSGSEDGGHYIESPLPIPLSYLLIAMLETGEKGKNIVVDLLEDIYEGQKSEHLPPPPGDEELPFVASDLSKIIYQDGEDPFDNDDMVKLRWKALASECGHQGKLEMAIDIRSALVVRTTIAKALSIIAEDEKEQFDYYT